MHYLLGNHEHAHVGGPVVAKFFPDEARRLEELLGEDGTREMRAWLRTWPLVALARRARIVMLHAAPHALVRGPEDLERLSLDGFDGTPLEDMAGRTILGALLWARTTTTDRAFSFLRALDKDARVAVFGHDVARGGYAVEREPLLCVSTSFGCFDGDKLYLEWDLAEPAESARRSRPGAGSACCTRRRRRCTGTCTCSADRRATQRGGQGGGARWCAGTPRTRGTCPASGCSVNAVDPWKSSVRRTGPAIVGLYQPAPAATEKR